MLRRVRRRLTILVVSFATAAAAAALPAAAAGSTWKPAFSDALNYAQSRAGIITFALRTPHHLWAYRPNHTEPSASVIKAMILVAYLDLPDVRYRKLSSGERDEALKKLAAAEKQFQVVSNLTRVAGNHTVKFGIDIRRAFNLRVPSDSHRSGQLYFNEQNTAGPAVPPPRDCQPLQEPAKVE